MPDAPSYEQLAAENAELRSENAELRRMVAVLTERVAELERRLAADSSNSSRPPSSDAPWNKPGADPVVADPVGPQSGQAARRAGRVAESERRLG